MLTNEEIRQLIPHRNPFLWVDEVVEFSESSILATKYIDPALDIFTGHFPKFPVFPGVLQCEAAFQTGAILIAKHRQIEEGQNEESQIEEGKIPVVTRVNNVKFRRMVKPGDTISIAVELNERLSNAFFLKSVIKVEGQVCTRLEFACAMADSE